MSNKLNRLPKSLKLTFKNKNKNKKFFRYSDKINQIEVIR